MEYGDPTLFQCQYEEVIEDMRRLGFYAVANSLCSGHLSIDAALDHVRARVEPSDELGTDHVAQRRRMRNAELTEFLDKHADKAMA